jgi:hypothetical protein
MNNVSTENVGEGSKGVMAERDLQRAGVEDSDLGQSRSLYSDRLHNA